MTLIRSTNIFYSALRQLARHSLWRWGTRPTSTRVLAHCYPSFLSVSLSSDNAPPKSKRRLKLGESSFNLEHFLIRRQVRSLWREIVRAVYKIPPSSTRTELLSYAKAEFVRNKDITDTNHIKYLVSSGRAEFDTMRRYIDELASR